MTDTPSLVSAEIANRFAEPLSWKKAKRVDSCRFRWKTRGFFWGV